MNPELSDMWITTFNGVVGLFDGTNLICIVGYTIS
jgi:hypothetical protein